MVKRTKFVGTTLALFLFAASFLIPSPTAALSDPSPNRVESVSSSRGQLRHAHRVLVFVSDGMRHDLMKQFAAEGLMPTYQRILRTGVEGEHGMIPNVVPNTGPGWVALGTGASPSVSGVTNNTFHNNAVPFAPFGVSAWAPGVNQAETIAKRAEGQGLTVAVLAWQTFDAATLTHGVVVDAAPDWLTGRGIVANYDVPLEWTNILSTGPFLSKTIVTPTAASGWTKAPASYSPAKEEKFSILSFFGSSLAYNFYIYDGTDDARVNYDSVLVSPTKDAGQAVAVLGPGEWSESIDVSISGIEGGFYLKAIDLQPDLSKFRLYFTPVTRVRASPQAVEDYIVDNFDAIRPHDFSPFILGLIDADTFVEQNIFTYELYANEIYPYVLETYDPDLVLAGIEWTDSVQHRFLARASPGTPVYDPVNGPTYWGYIEQGYHESDRMLNSLWSLMPDANVFVTSDHGFSNSWMSINANYVLQTLGLYIPGNLANSRAVAYAAGGTAQIYINLQGRNPGGIVSPGDYDSVRQQIEGAFNALGPTVIERVLLKEDTAAIATTMGVTYNMLHPDRTGDVVVFSRPPYQFDAPSPGAFTAPTPIYGQHGFLPNGDLDRFATFAAAGPDIIGGPGAVIGPVTALDLAPTVAKILGIDPPAQSEGKVLPILLPCGLHNRSAKCSP